MRSPFEFFQISWLTLGEAPSATIPLFPNSTFASVVAGITAPPNQCGQCGVLAGVVQYYFESGGSSNCTVATVFETVGTANGSLVTSASTESANTSSCIYNPFVGIESPMTLISGGMIVDGYT